MRPGTERIRLEGLRPSVLSLRVCTKSRLGRLKPLQPRHQVRLRGLNAVPEGALRAVVAATSVARQRFYYTLLEPPLLLRSGSVTVNRPGSRRAEPVV